MRRAFLLMIAIKSMTCAAQHDSLVSVPVAHGNDTSISNSPSANNLFTLKLPAQAQVIVSKENIVYYTTAPTVSPIEKQIAELESRECSALKKRDGITLSRLWVRDFSLDKKQNEIVNGSNSLPNYLSLSRVIEKITVINDDLVYTSGYELFQEFNTSATLPPAARRTYFHAWRKDRGIWRLASKVIN
jgi:hypothetical protein